MRRNFAILTALAVCALLVPAAGAAAKASPAKTCTASSPNVIGKTVYCVPTVKSTEPDVVAYKCTFKGADTATFIKLLFQVKYDQD